MAEVSIRRNLEQAKHCVVEALNAIECDDDYESADADVHQARVLLLEIKERIVAMIKEKRGHAALLKADLQGNANNPRDGLRGALETIAALECLEDHDASETPCPAHLARRALVPTVR